MPCGWNSQSLDSKKCEAVRHLAFKGAILVAHDDERNAERVDPHGDDGVEHGEGVPVGQSLDQMVPRRLVEDPEELVHLAGVVVCIHDVHGESVIELEGSRQSTRWSWGWCTCPQTGGTSEGVRGDHGDGLGSIEHEVSNQVLLSGVSEVDVDPGDLAPDLSRTLFRCHMFEPDLVRMFLARCPAAWCLFTCVVELECGPWSHSRSMCVISGIPLTLRGFSEDEYGDPHGSRESQSRKLDACCLFALIP